MASIPDRLEKLERRVGGIIETAPRWVIVRDLCARFRVSKTTIWDWVAQGKLPKPYHLGEKAVWRPADIDAAEARLLRPPEAG